jgi:hypothetical protein
MTGGAVSDECRSVNSIGPGAEDGRIPERFALVETAADRVRRWAADHALRVLDGAGPRESERPGAEATASARVCKVFAACGLPSAPPRG